MYIVEQSNLTFFNQNFQYILERISSFELQTTTIANFKPHGLVDSLTPHPNRITFCSPIVDSDEITFCF
jgi:hypothetical protein